MKYMIKDWMKRKIIPAILSIALGILIIIARRSALDLLVKIVGGMMIASGLAFVAIYLTREEREKGSLQLTLLMTAATVILGLLLIFFAEAVVDFFPVMMGIFLILNGLAHLTESASVEGADRFISGIMGVIIIIFGILIVLQPGVVANALMIYIGVFFVVNGLFDLFLSIRANRNDEM